MQTRKIVITGGPGTGKTALVEALRLKGFYCFDEISREITLKARLEGVEQLFLEDPILFSEKLLEGRKGQFLSATKRPEPLVFLDRGLPDVLAYMNFIGDEYPHRFKAVCNEHVYDQVFVLKPWKAIFKKDAERYENFDQATEIYHHLEATYSNFGYTLKEVPFGSVESRAQFVLDSL